MRTRSRSYAIVFFLPVAIIQTRRVAACEELLSIGGSGGATRKNAGHRGELSVGALFSIFCSNSFLPIESEDEESLMLAKAGMFDFLFNVIL
jgi:hypothetical protein